MKTTNHTRVSVLLATSMVALTLGSARSESFKLTDYFYPAQQGATWSYRGTGWGGYASNERVTMARTSWSLNLFTGRKSPETYRKDVLRFKFERDFDGGGGDTWYEYFGKGSSYTPYGMDDDGEHERVDGGLVFPSSVSVGKTYAPNADFYYNGRFQGNITYSLRVIDALPVTVKAGTFRDCVHLLFTFKQGNKVFQTNEMWWAKGVGVIKKKDVDEDGETRRQELVSSTLKTGPEISIQQPKGTNLVDGVAKKSFGTIALGKTSPARTFTIKNSGTTTLKGLGIKKSGANAGDFTIAQPSKSALAPGDSTTFKVSFKPSGDGARTAILHVSSNDADEDPFEISLSGQGVK